MQLLFHDDKTMSYNIHKYYYKTMHTIPTARSTAIDILHETHMGHKSLLDSKKNLYNIGGRVRGVQAL